MKSFHRHRKFQPPISEWMPLLCPHWFLIFTWILLPCVNNVLPSSWQCFLLSWFPDIMHDTPTRLEQLLSHLTKAWRVDCHSWMLKGEVATSGQWKKRAIWRASKYADARMRSDSSLMVITAPLDWKLQMQLSEMHLPSSLGQSP